MRNLRGRIINNTRIKFQKIIQTGLAVAVLSSIATPALAVNFDAQIQQLNSSINSSQAQVNSLSQQKDTLSNKVAALNAQIETISSQIQLNSVKASKLQSDITAAQEKMAIQKSVLDENIRTVYQESNITPIEMLASSKSFSEYVDRQEYQDRVKEKIQNSMEEIKKLKKSLENQQADLTAAITNQKIQQQSLASAKAEQAQLLADTQNQESKYAQVVADNKKQLQAVYAQRAALDAKNNVKVSTSGGSGSSYPYANLGPDSQSDPWGFYVRECVSYVAWKRRAVGRSPYPSYWGNAADWAYAAPTTSSPSAGAIAIWAPGVQTAGPVGHVAYVESVNGDGTINVSEYNWRPYIYTYRTGVSPSGLRFIQ